MGEIINLKRARKQKARTADEASAHANRIEHGRTKREKKLTKADKDVSNRKLDGHKLKPESARGDD